jgi:hypothetical protein
MEINDERFQRFLDDLVKAPEKVLPYASRAMELSTLEVKSQMAQYPPETEANRPGRVHMVKRATKHALESRLEPMGYYERGKGWWSPIKRREKLNSIAEQRGGFGRSIGRGVIRKRGVSHVVGYKLHPNSENLGKKWVTEVRLFNRGVMGVVGNNVTYAPFVQGDKQSKLFAMRKWMNLDSGLENASPTINEAFSKEMDKYIKDLGK